MVALALFRAAMKLNVYEASAVVRAWLDDFALPLGKSVDSELRREAEQRIK
jgi:hypothetical protein